VLRRLQEYLKRSEALLTVDYLALGHGDGGRPQLLQDNCAEEVPSDRLVGRRVQDTLCKGAYIVPQRLPLALLAPDVGALEQRHRVARLLAKNLTN
jgi:hypothetical protein